MRAIRPAARRRRPAGLVLLVVAVVVATIGVAGAASAGAVPRYPISTDVQTTAQRTIVLSQVNASTGTIYPDQINLYGTYGYGSWKWGPGSPIAKRVDIMPNDYAGADESNAASLLRFFAFTDIHITDEETPANAAAMGYQGGISSAYSPVEMLTTQVFDAAVQTMNAIAKKTKIDFALSIGDVANVAQTNEVQWYIDVLDGKVVKPDSGVMDDPIPGPGNDYQDAFQAAGLQIPWYQTIGNHDHFWLGSLPINDYLAPYYVGTKIVNLGNPYTSPLGGDVRGLYMGALDGRTVDGTVYGAGPVSSFATDPTVPAADPDRAGLATVGAWAAPFLKSTSKPAGHGLTQAAVDSGFVSYSFVPKVGIPVKVIVLDDTNSAESCLDGVGGCGAAYVDQKRYDWLVSQLEAGQKAGHLMIIAMHVPIGVATPPNPIAWSAKSAVTQDEFIAKLHTYPNLVAILAGHRHMNDVTAFPSTDPAHPEQGFWQIETSSLRDYPQVFRQIELTRNTDGTVSIRAIDVNPAAKTGSLAALSRRYSVAAQQLFQNTISPGLQPDGIANVECVKALTPEMSAKLATLGTPIK